MKRIALVTSSNFSKGSTGISQTLENLFDGYPETHLLVCSPDPVSGTFQKFRIVTYLSKFRNLIGTKYFPTKLIELFFPTFRLASTVSKIKVFNPEVIIIANLDKHPAAIAEAAMKQTQASLIVYLLDNLVPSADKKLDELYEGLMKSAEKHIFISKYMAIANAQKFKEVKKWLVLHNPIDEHQIAKTSQITVSESSPVTIAYAGAIWQMHKDALIAFAESISLLRKEKGWNIKLVVYTASHFASMHKEDFERWGIEYGGFYPFLELKKFLPNHQALLVTSSFEQQFYDLSAYSVQTKITDYLASGVPVIAIGPDYSACNMFIEEHNCGFVIKTNNPESISQEISRFIQNDASIKAQMANNGLNLVREKHNKKKIQEELFLFINH